MRRAVIAGTLVLSGCGSLAARDLPPAAVPAVAPPLDRPAEGKVVHVGPRPTAISYDARTERVTVSTAHQRVLLRPATGAILARTRQSAALPPVGRVAAGAGRIAMIDGRARTLSVSNGDHSKTINAGVGPTQVVYDGDNRLWIADTDGDAVLTIRLTPKLQVFNRTRVPGAPYALAYDPARERLYVTRTAANQVTELDTHRFGLHTVRRYPTVRQPDAITVDPRTHRVFIAGQDDGVVQLLDPVGYFPPPGYHPPAPFAGG